MNDKVGMENIEPTGAPKNEKPRDAEQKFTVGQDGSIDIGWIQPEFSDAILEICPDDKKINDELNGGKKPRIFCG